MRASAVALVLLAACGGDATPEAAGACLGDDGDMILVGGGVAELGCDESRYTCAQNDMPAVTREVAAFAIDRREVSTAEYQLCVEARVCDEAFSAGVREPDWPAGGMPQAGAAAYCDWVGKRLPMFDEWQVAARGQGGAAYPWGDEEPTCERARFESCGDIPVAAGSLVDGGSSCGAIDLAGNVSEFTATGQDLPGTGSSSAYFFFGGDYRSAPPGLRAFAIAGDEDIRFLGAAWVGFRCAR